MRNINRRMFVFSSSAAVITLGIPTTKSNANPILPIAYGLYLVYRLGRVTLFLARTILAAPVRKRIYAAIVQTADKTFKVTKAAYNSKLLNEALKAKGVASMVEGIATLAEGGAALARQYVLEEGDSTALSGMAFKTPLWFETRKKFEGGSLQFELKSVSNRGFREVRSVRIPPLAKKVQKSFGELYFDNKLEDDTYILTAKLVSKKGKVISEAMGKFHAIDDELKGAIDELLKKSS